GGALLLQSETGRGAAAYTGGQLATLVGRAKVRMAVLCACDTAQTSPAQPWSGVAETLIQANVAAVVSSFYSLEDASAIAMVPAIYEKLLSTGSVDEAVSK